MSSLWQGDDHLVYVKGSGFLIPFSEEYRRFRYKDIQSLTLTKTNRLLFSLLHLTGFLVFAGLIAIVIAVSGLDEIGVGMMILLSILLAGAILFLLLFLRHLILGPTCRCYLQTNLKRELIKPLNRLHTANQAIGRMSPGIQETQQDLEGARSEVSKTAASGAGAAAAREESDLKVSGFVIPTFAIFAVFGLLILIALHLESMVLNGIGLALLTIGSLAVVATLISCIRYATPESIRTFLWILLGQIFVFAGMSAVYFVMTASRNPEYTIGMTGPLEAFAVVSSEGGIGFYLGYLALTVSMFLVSVFGVLQALKWKGRISAVAEPGSKDTVAEPKSEPVSETPEPSEKGDE